MNPLSGVLQIEDPKGGLSPFPSGGEVVVAEVTVILILVAIIVALVGVVACLFGKERARRTLPGPPLG